MQYDIDLQRLSGSVMHINTYLISEVRVPNSGEPENCFLSHTGFQYSCIRNINCWTDLPKKMYETHRGVLTIHSIY